MQGVRGIVIAAMPVKANVVEIVQAVLQRYKTSGVTTSRYLVRMYPLQVTCAGQMKTLLAALNPLLDAHFARAETPKSPTVREALREAQQRVRVVAGFLFCNSDGRVLCHASLLSSSRLATVAPSYHVAQ